MRLACFACSCFLLIGISAAQDTDFPAGPQYLLTGSPLFAQSVATPSRSLDAPLPPVVTFPEDEQAPATEPGATNSEPSAQINVEPALQANLLPIFYGYTAPGSIEELPGELPESITDGGVTSLITAQSLEQQGYGVPLGDTAAFWKAHKPRAPRIFTNADVERLHGS